MRPLTPKEKVIKEAKNINFDRVASTDFKEFLLEYYQKIEELEARIKSLEGFKGFGSISTNLLSIFPASLDISISDSSSTLFFLLI